MLRLESLLLEHLFLLSLEILIQRRLGPVELFMVDVLDSLLASQTRFLFQFSSLNSPRTFLRARPDLGERVLRTYVPVGPFEASLL